MRIGELARATGTTVETVRFYEQEGLLGTTQRKPNGYRSYGAHQVRRLAFVRQCRALDIGLEEIRDLIALVDDPTADCSAADALVEHRLESIRSRIEELRALQRQLELLRARCGAPGQARACGILEQLQKPARG